MEEEKNKKVNRFQFFTDLNTDDLRVTNAPEKPMDAAKEEKPKKKRNYKKTSVKKKTNYRKGNSKRTKKTNVKEQELPKENQLEEIIPSDDTIIKTEEVTVGKPVVDDVVSEPEPETVPEPEPETVPEPKPEVVPEPEPEVVPEPEAVAEDVMPEAPVPETIMPEILAPEVVIPYEETANSPQEEKLAYEELSLPVIDEENVSESVPNEVNALPDEQEEVIPYEEKENVKEPEYHQELSSIQEKGINVGEVKDIDLDHTLYRDQYFVSDKNSEDEVVDDVKAAMQNHEEIQTGETIDKEMKHSIRKIYISFQTRVVLLIIGILLLFGAACYLIFTTLKENETKKVDFVEKTTIHYDVCTASTSPFDTNCLKEGKEYTAKDASIVHIDYHYEALFSRKIDYDLSYHVVVINKIFDRLDLNKISYEDEDIIKDVKEISQGDNPATIDTSVEIDYKKYYQFVNDYRSKYSTNADANLSVILYVDDGNETRNVGEVVIPLGNERFDITRKEVTDSKQVYLMKDKDWTNTNTLYIVVGSILVLLSMFLLFHLTKLSLAITGKKSKYQEYLMSLLNEYDRLIVIARDGFETNVEKKIIKVYTFDELLDARSILNKPIVYSRINNVKSEFIVEDEDVIYKFVLKEADMGE